MECRPKSVAIIGAGPAGCMCAYYASKKYQVTLFDEKPLHTILCTGGGRCNLAYQEYDFRELASFYPRGEKFLYSVFSKFSTADTLDFFKEIGVDIYVQEDFRFFPTSNSAKEVRANMLNSLKNCKIINEKVVSLKRDENKFSLKAGKCLYCFDSVVVAVGGHSGFDLAKVLGHKIISPKPSLTGLVTSENFKNIQGVSLRNILAEISCGSVENYSLTGDLIFTHEGISGPLAYRISSICAREDYNKAKPLKIELNLLHENFELQELLNANPKKDIKNLISEFVPKSMADFILKLCNVDLSLKCCNVNGKTRDLILKNLKSFEINVVSPTKEGEVVTSGGVCLDEINPKTMQSKLVDGLYFCGEVIDVDGFCGGFNLQNCWSTGFVAGTSI